ncbi:MAG: methyltransferase, partial [Planctomycetota bacterium]|nr:methyltransferase [Planctomycetota bacterium]
PVRFADGMAELATMGVDVFLEIGPKPVLTALGRQCLGQAVPQNELLWLPTLRPGQDDWSQILQTLAELYLHGAEVDWEGFDQDYSRRKLPLPTYPFQRQRYWFTDSLSEDEVSARELSARGRQAGRSMRSTTSRAPAAAPLHDAFYEIQWQPKSLFSQPNDRHAANYLAEPSRLAELVRPEVDRLQRQLNLERYRTLEDEMDRLSVAYVRAAFDRLGWKLQPREQVSWSTLVQRLGIVESQQALCGRMLEMLVEEGLLSGGDGSWIVADHVPQTPDPEQLSADLTTRFPECDAELELLHQCGRNLADVLCGAGDPLQVLFPDGSSAMVERLYADSPFARSLNSLVEESIARALEDRPAQRPLRILEIGAGTGGTTAQILPRLPADCTEYVFTDVSEIFTREAQRKFRKFPFVRYGALDIEVDPAQQGFAAEQFDIVLAANVLHATRDLRQAIGHVRQLLAPQGMLVLLEGTRPQRWLDLIFGLTDGWWRFEDSDLRPTHPLISGQQWTGVLKSSGFESATALPGSLPRDDGAVDAPQSVVIARRDARRDSRSSQEFPPLRSSTEDCWLIFADRQGVGEGLAALLDERRVPNVLVLHGAQYQQMDENKFAICTDSEEDLQRVVQRLRSDGRTVGRVVHLYSLDAAAAADLSVDSLSAAEAFGCQSALRTVQSVGRAGWAENARVWLVTRGAQPVVAGQPLPGVAQSPLWGLGRVISE